ncbi:recombinase family protein [Alicyclobacillus fastidiosus]|uniref:Recombinase family protein n=1 Tax=Alicyclobacillus fastidiosus TaxID=392011 RepID=A0ABY6ZJZ8_9BACL|nr:recombinase family protein [Alicyclobacillus fastidiosus]WAH43258.1 recombinase family protein [Alicyclobacillus fastidiosus]GMA65302.1 hypothetical protein GCM10025859_57420 [Alicyclobacillus fastidiosus]
MSLHNNIPQGIGVIYVRYSTKKQEKELQVGTIERVKKKYNMTADEIYLDPGVSATKVPKDKRPDLQRLLNDAKAGKFQYILTYNSDRLARNATEHREIRVEMARLGIPIILCSTETIYDTGDLVGQLVQDGFTQFEAEQIRARTRDMVRTRAVQGKWFSGPLPYGYTFNEKTQQYEPTPEAKVHVKEMFAAYMRGQSFSSIAAGLPIEQNHGRKWTKERVRSIITNPFYAGKTRVFKSNPKSPNSILPKEKWVMGDSDKIVPIITMEQWEQCWHLFEQKRQGIVPPRTFNTPYLLKDLIHCYHSDEDQPLMFSKNYSNPSDKRKLRDRRVYVCSHPSCNHKIFAEDAERVVLQEVEAIIYRQAERIGAELKRQLEHELKELQEAIRSFQKANEENEMLIYRAGRELKAFAEMENKEESKTLRYVMLQYRLELQQKVQSNNALIEEKKRRIQYINDVELKSNTWADVLSEAEESKDMRRLLLYLLKEVIVYSNNTMKVVARIDTEM